MGKHGGGKGHLMQSWNTQRVVMGDFVEEVAANLRTQERLIVERMGYQE